MRGCSRGLSDADAGLPAGGSSGDLKTRSSSPPASVAPAKAAVFWKQMLGTDFPQRVYDEHFHIFPPPWNPCRYLSRAFLAGENNKYYLGLPPLPRGH